MNDTTKLDLAIKSLAHAIAIGDRHQDIEGALREFAEALREGKAAEPEAKEVS